MFKCLLQKLKNFHSEINGGALAQRATPLRGSSSHVCCVGQQAILYSSRYYCSGTVSTKTFKTSDHDLLLRYKFHMVKEMRVEQERDEILKTLLFRNNKALSIQNTWKYEYD